MNTITDENKAVETAENERPYTLRKLKDSDFFPLLKILSMLGLKPFKSTLVAATARVNELRESGVEADTKAVVVSMIDEVGIDFVADMAIAMIEGLETGAGEAIYEFYSRLSGLTVAEIKDMEFGTLPLMIFDSFNEVKNTSFFKALAKSL